MKRRITSVSMVLILLICEVIIYKSYSSGSIPLSIALVLLISAAVPAVYAVFMLVKGKQVRLKVLHLILAVIAAAACVFLVYKAVPHPAGKSALITVTATGEKNPDAASSEVWLRIQKDGKFINMQPYANTEWTLRNDRIFSAPKFQPSSITLNLEYTDNLSLHFRKHAWSGIVQIKEAGKTTRMDLSADNNTAYDAVGKQGGVPYLLMISAFLVLFSFIYLIISKLPGLVKNYRASEKPEARQKDFLDWPMLTVILSALYPTLFLLQINSHMFEYKAMAATAGIILLCTAALSLIFIPLSRALPYKTVSAAAMAVSSVIILVLFHSKIHGFLWFIAVAGALLIVFLAYSRGLRVINILLSVLILIVCLNWVRGYYDAHKTARAFSSDGTSDYSDVELTSKPNVYLLILESYHSPEAMKKLYNYDNSEFLKYLKDRNYHAWENSFSSYSFTMASVASLFAMDQVNNIPMKGSLDGNAYRDIIGGKYGNTALKILKNNNYKVQYLFGEALHFHTPMLDYDLLTSNLFAPMAVFEIDALTEKVQQQKLKNVDMLFSRIDYAAKNKPVFTAVKLGAMHTPSRFDWYPDKVKKMPEFSEYAANKDFISANKLYWKDAYIEAVKAANKELVSVIDYIEAQDPEAVVILIGDHGAWFYRGTFPGDANAELRKRGVEPNMLALDANGAFLAIKAPKGYSFPDAVYTVNVFRQVFASLGSENILATSKPDRSYWGSYLTSENGTALDNLTLTDIWKK